MDLPGRPDGRGLTGIPVEQRALLDHLLERCTLPPAGAPVTCAVSGGADSLALLVLAVAAGGEVTAVHVDHGLRPGSAAEAGVVAAAAERFGAAFRSETVRVEAGPNLEARARAARFAVLPDDVCTGHTADDRAETMLLNVLRGAGPAGMGPLPPGPRHPIVRLRRAETHDLCAALGLHPVDDPSNTDPAFLRNRVRHELLPLLGDLGGRDPIPVLVRQAELFAELDADLRAAASAVDPTDVAALRLAPRSVARVAVRSWLVAAGVGEGYAVDAAAVERVLAVAAHDRRATELAGGWRLVRRDGRLQLQPPA